MAQNFWKSSHAQQWIFDKTEIWKQRAEDMKVYNEEEYNRLNIFWANFITAVATEYAHSHANGGYKLRQQMIATAIVYFKRFYLRQSFRDICPFLVASTALFLACKVEETSIPTSASSFLKHTSTVLQKRWAVPFEPNPAKHGGIYDPEFLLVEILDCCLVVHHPFRPMIEFLDDFRQFSLCASGTNTPVKDTDAIEAQCQKVANDSLRCDVGLIFPPHIVALSSIIVAMELMGRGEELEGWLVEVDVDIEKVIDCVDQIYKMYTLWKSFDEKEEVKKLMAKLPKPNSPIVNQQQQPSTSNNYF